MLRGILICLFVVVVGTAIAVIGWRLRKSENSQVKIEKFEWLRVLFLALANNLVIMGIAPFALGTLILWTFWN
ncbi:MAG: hypothetical protein DHS20C04_18540 [Hyphococcus sp.]|nr:MAG: hypothetical protein DHS20C04_18540 [Marinicaulis sp.]